MQIHSNNTKGLLVLGLCCTLCLGTGCGSLYYSPPGQLIAKATKKGELNAAAVVPTDVAGLNVQASYSPVQYLGVTASYLYLNKRRLESAFGGTVTSSISYGDVSVGGYYPWTVVSLEEDFAILIIPELYLGTGRGSARNNYRTKQDFSLLHYNRHFAQAGLQIKVGPYLSLIASHQWIHLDYRLATLNGFDLPASVLIDINDIRAEDPFSFTETSLGVAAGIKGVKLSGSMTFASPALDGRLSRFQQTFFFFGITFEISEMLKY